MNKPFYGLTTALITPFNVDGSINTEDFRSFVDWQLQEGIKNFVLFGSTGEGFSLSSEERYELFQIVSQQRANTDAKNVKIIVTASHPNTQVAVQQAVQAMELGADGVLATTPCYVKPSQQGLYEHFMAILKAVSIPVILYNNPGRTVTEIAVETVVQLARNPLLLGLKDSTNSLIRPVLIRNAMKKRDTEFLILAGDDENAVMINLNGGKGCVSVASNVIPKLCNHVQTLCAAKQWQEAEAAHAKLMPFYKALQCDSNPVPIKYAVFKAGLISSPTMRLPLMALPEGKRLAVDHELSALVGELPIMGENTVSQYVVSGTRYK